MNDSQSVNGNRMGAFQSLITVHILYVIRQNVIQGINYLDANYIPFCFANFFAFFDIVFGFPMFFRVFKNSHNFPHKFPKAIRLFLS